MIAEAVHEVGLTDVTLRAVAEHLDVSVAGLYHHIDSKQDLMALAAEHAARRATPPVDDDQHWALWLREWAHYNRDAFTGQPELVGQYLEGGIRAELFAENYDIALGLLVRQGFSIAEAFHAYDVVSSCALGSALSVLREQHLTEAGRPTGESFAEVLATRPDDELPHLRKLIAELSSSLERDFDDEIVTVLRGIAVRRGARWKSIEDRLDDARAAP